MTIAVGRSPPAPSSAAAASRSLSPASADRIRTERADVEIDRYLETLRAQAQIEWKDETFRALYQKAQAERGKGAGPAR